MTLLPLPILGVALLLAFLSALGCSWSLRLGKGRSIALACALVGSVCICLVTLPLLPWLDLGLRRLIGDRLTPSEQQALWLLLGGSMLVAFATVVGWCVLAWCIARACVRCTFALGTAIWRTYRR